MIILFLKIKKNFFKENGKKPYQKLQKPYQKLQKPYQKLQKPYQILNS